MTRTGDSIFRKYYREESFIDRFLSAAGDAADVIIPVIHTNELWEANLRSIYREIPVNRLLIGDGGCLDDSIAIAQKFPRVTVCDHKKYKSLGYSIRKLIEEVQTEWFIYPHSDVYLPAGWFDAMKKDREKYGWLGCPMRNTVMVEYDQDYGERPWAGAQMGMRKAFKKGLDAIDDDYVYRQEDFVWRKIITDNGFKEGFVDQTFHYHQTMHKPSPWLRKACKVQITAEMSREEEVRTCETMAKGIVKYLAPPLLTSSVVQNVDRLAELGVLNWADFYLWVKETNPSWLPYIRRERAGTPWSRITRSLRKLKRAIVKKL